MDFGATLLFNTKGKIKEPHSCTHTGSSSLFAAACWCTFIPLVWVRGNRQGEHPCIPSAGCLYDGFLPEEERVASSWIWSGKFVYLSDFRRNHAVGSWLQNTGPLSSYLLRVGVDLRYKSAGAHYWTHCPSLSSCCETLVHITSNKLDLFGGCWHAWNVNTSPIFQMFV